MIYTVFETKALVWKSNDKNGVPIFFVQSLVGPSHVFGLYLKLFKIKRSKTFVELKDQKYITASCFQLLISCSYIINYDNH